MVNEKSLIPKFSRKMEDFLTWCETFKFYTEAKKFGQAVRNTSKPELPAATDIVLDPMREAPAIAARKYNNMTCAAIAMVMLQDNIPLIHGESTDSSWLEGKACLMVKAIYER